MVSGIWPAESVARSMEEVQVKLLIIGGLALAATCLGACNKPAGSGPGSHHGRYVGIGIYLPQTPWTKMVAANTPKETPAARTIDDQAIIVVIDSDTGEIRGCGDLSGYCIGMNPWSKALTAAQIAPINLTEHVRPPKPDADAAASAPSAPAAAQ